MKPFFSYFGSKYRLAKHYPAPLPGLPVVECFAGSAAYSVYYDAPEVRLYDVNSTVCGIWDYLINATSAEIMALPDHVTEDVYEFQACAEARALIGFWLAKARGKPATKAGPWSQKYHNETSAHVWGPAARARIAAQVDRIRGWKVFNEEYHEAPAERATWFIDPPYVTSARKQYEFSEIDYSLLAAFSYDRKGLVINCDDISAKYLPFKEFRETQGVSKNTTEAMWTRERT